MTKMNTKAWGSDNHGRQLSADQNRKGKKWYVSIAPIRCKWRWNKKAGVYERSKKGAQHVMVWAD